MNKSITTTLTGMSLMLLSACGGGASAPAASAPAVVALPTAPTPVPIPLPQPPAPQPNRDGAALTFTAAGAIDAASPFFRPISNGRSCATCHDQGQGWSLTPQGLQARFAASDGNDPVFRLVDGANSPLAPAQTLDQKRLAYSMLLTRGVIRIGLPIPAGAEFTLARADDPYGFASATELSLFRRPLPSANLKFAATVMWDGRETLADAGSTLCIRGANPAQCFAPLDVNLASQANSAVRGHAQATAGLSAADQRAIVDFEKALFVAAGGGLHGAAARQLHQLPQCAQQRFAFGGADVQYGRVGGRAQDARYAAVHLEE
jgi:hypothetical protein